MAFKLHVISTDQDKVFQLTAQGEAVAADFPLGPGPSLFEALLGSKWMTHSVLLDMEGVPYVDSSAIGWLISAQKGFRTGGGQLVLHSVQPAVRNILSLLKIERVVPIAVDAAAARSMLAPVGKPQTV
jgi:anti-sigma B factor antagonist